MLRFKYSAAGAIGAAMAALFAPPKKISPARWTAKNLYVPDGPRANELWDPTLTPYVVEPLDNTGPDSPVNKQVIKKSAQTGFTVMAIAAAGASIVTDPAGGILLVQPTDGALADFIADKLNPAIEQTDALKAKVKPQVSRSGEGSTTYLKRYPGGSMALAIANSTKDLRSKTKRKIIKDEASDYPPDLDGQGSPHAMIEARYESFLATGDWKETNISTPTIKGACYIDEQYHAGDQRLWHVDCPHCDEPFSFRFGPQFKFNDSFPYQAHYIAPCCGAVIEAHEKIALVRAGSKRAPRSEFLESLGLRNGFIATAPGPGKFPSYHVDAMSSPFVPWDKIAERWIAAQSNPGLLKTFYNLTLGEAYEMKGDAPDHVRLMERREDFPRGRIPARGLMVTFAADVQMRGIYVEGVAWAPNRESWVIYADVLEGDTTDANSGAFLKLAELYDREWPDAFGGKRRHDGFIIDSGFRSHVVYHFCSTRHNAYAADGRDGWNKPPLGVPSLVSIDLDGRKLGSGKIWPVGTWPLKGHWYEDLRREGRKAGHEVDPPGYCHFGNWLDETYFKQVTAEYLADKTISGRPSKRWVPRGAQENHFLDCRIYNMALADHLGLSTMTEDEWKILARERAPGMSQGDLFAPRTLALQIASGIASAAAVSDAAAEPPADQDASPHTNASDDAPPAAPLAEPIEPVRADPAPASSGWLGRDTSGWLDR
ncbi:phage terminase large subunit family protein [Rhodopseudomonas sp. B29]|uniref:phage terminase large subunit family protein n=1 Tax=Rhodopseudomonas sp. B29 TaxID=95607 RepID=UPI000348F1CF|nr:terminase gpA endonuclease subunit [Rhodopseudomonas sp. B29]